MVLIRNNVKKESTYGWYPAQVDIYQNSRAKHGYDKEMLFNHFKSKLHHTNPEGVSPVCTPMGLKGKALRVKSATPRSQRGSKIEIVRPQTAVRYKENGNPLYKLRIEGSGAAVNEFPPELSPQTPPTYHSQLVSRQHIPTLKVSRKYHGWQPQPTIIGVVDPDGPFINTTPEPEIEIDEVSSPAAPAPEPTERVLTPPIEPEAAIVPAATRLTPAQRISGSFRVQSAGLHRAKVSAARTIKSASSRSWTNRPESSSVVLDSHTAKVIYDEEAKRSRLAATSYLNQLKHELDTFEEPEAPSSSPREDLEVEDIPVDSTNYNQMMDKYGWRMEAHGDPYRLKKAAMPQRLPYTVKCTDPSVAENPYSVKVMVGETFFYNTIPQKPATFTVHPEWQSEHFVKERKELEKQGRKFQTRNYGFVY